MINRKNVIIKRVKRYVIDMGSEQLKLTPQAAIPLDDEARFIFHICKELEKNGGPGWDLQFLAVARNRLVRYLSMSLEAQLDFNISHGVKILTDIEDLADTILKEQ